MASPLRPAHVLLTPEQISYLRLKAGQHNTSLSHIIRELVAKDQAREKAAARRRRDETT